MNDISNFYKRTQQLLTTFVEETVAGVTDVPLIQAPDDFSVYITKLSISSNTTQRSAIKIGGNIVLPYRIGSTAPIIYDFFDYPLVVPPQQLVEMTRNTASEVYLWCQYYLVEE